MDWEGKPIKEYILDYSLTSFDLDLRNNAIYGLAMSNNRDEKVHLVKFLLDDQ